MVDLGSVFVGELLGTMVLILLGDGVIANVVLKQSKGYGGGWIVITTGWGFGILFGVTTAIATGSPYGFINPAVAIAFGVAGKVSWDVVGVAIVSSIVGAFIGGVLAYLAYMRHFSATDDPRAKLGVFATTPQIRDLPSNFLTEAIATFMLVLGALASLKILGQATFFVPYIIGVLVWNIGLSLGGPTGFAINPARDLGPRIAHAVLPIPSKGGSDWSYGLTVPIFGPIVGGIIASLLGRVLGL